MQLVLRGRFDVPMARDIVYIGGSGIIKRPSEGVLLGIEFVIVVGFELQGNAETRGKETKTIVRKDRQRRLIQDPIY